MTQSPTNPNEPTPVDDVRRVRERLDREAQGDIHVLAQQYRATVERYRVTLKLKLVSPPDRETPGEEKIA